MGNKIGPNEKCPCGSGIKYKKCHGFIGQNFFKTNSAIERQREKQQGKGNAIIATRYQGGITVALGSLVTHYPKAQTFHEVLFEYLYSILDKAWLRNEVQSSNRHPIAQWYLDGRNHLTSAKIAFPNLKVNNARMTGALEAQLGLAWNLFNIQSNLNLQQKLIKRIKKNDSNFMGALYETYVIAAFIKAGFLIELEDEDDPTKQHGEFIAIHPSGKRYWVEAKNKQPESNQMNYRKSLFKALSKSTNLERIIFIGFHSNEITSEKSVEIQNEIYNKQHEHKLADGSPTSPAYIFFTNQAFHSDVHSISKGLGFFVCGYKIDGFPAMIELLGGVKYISCKKRDLPLYDLMKSLKENSLIPSTIDGNLPEFAYAAADAPARLIIGNYFNLELQGKNCLGKLITGAVDVSSKIATCSFEIENKGNFLYTIPLTDLEISAYKRSPDTFFGEIINPTGKVESYSDLFDFLFESAIKYTPDHLEKEIRRLNIDQAVLIDRTEEEKVAIYCEILTRSETGNYKVTL